ncbi:hypothetical protein [Raineyella sp.]|uniref:hypothetical protein n=1 Tax=Raineyella sp. TaxID=1911550 RepID=UPI002B21D091|nr:hypothetical protein [Raineyella sp.]MEA5155089.1 hypothetical protein [Raineyella sp.]
MTGPGKDTTNNRPTGRAGLRAGAGQGADGGIPAPAPFGAVHTPASHIPDTQPSPAYDPVGDAPAGDRTMVRDAGETRLRPAVGAPEVDPAPRPPELPTPKPRAALPAGSTRQGHPVTGAKKDKDGSGWTHPKVTSIVAGAGAAATSTLIGGHLGVAGTVIGAAVASIITTLAVNIYENTLRNGVHRVRSAWKGHGDNPARSGPDGTAAAPDGTAVSPDGTTVIPDRTAVIGATAGEAAAFGAGDTSAPDDSTDDATTLTPGGRRLPIRLSRRTIVVTGLTALVATVLGLGVMVGLEHGSATPITPGTSRLAGTGSTSKSTGSDSSTTTQDHQSGTTTGTETGPGTATTTARATPSTVATPPRPSASSGASTGTSGGTSGDTSGTTGSGTTGDGSGRTSGNGTSGTTNGTTGSGSTGSTTGQ